MALTIENSHSLNKILPDYPLCHHFKLRQGIQHRELVESRQVGEHVNEAKALFLNDNVVLNHNEAAVLLARPAIVDVIADITAAWSINPSTP